MDPIISVPYADAFGTGMKHSCGKGLNRWKTRLSQTLGNSLVNELSSNLIHPPKNTAKIIN